MAGLKVPQATLDKASKFLDSMQADGGAKYGETSPQDISDRSTAAGLCARQFLGWKRDNPALLQGVQNLSAAGFSKKDVVCNYYARQFMHRMNGYEWDKWNRQMPSSCAMRRCRQGDEAGSWWNPDNVHAAGGGRLFQTALNCLSMGIYHVWLPLFKNED